MRPATIEFLYVYCNAILKAQSEEELVMIKQAMTAELRKYDYSEEAIQDFFLQADALMENEEKLMQGDYLETNTELGEPIQFRENSNPNQGTPIGGLGLTALMVMLAVRQKMLKKDKIDEESKTR